MNKSTCVAARPMASIIWSNVAAVGIDLGDRFSRFVCLDRSGRKIGEGRVATTAAAFRKQFAVGAQCIAIETGTHSPWVSRLLSALGHEVVVANSRKLRLIYENRNKNDAVDAEYLARLVRVDRDLLSPVTHRSEHAQQQLAVLGARETLVRTRTRWINTVRCTFKSNGLRVPACSAEAFAKRAASLVPPALEPALGPLLKLIAEVNKQISAFDRRIERLLEDEHRDARVLTQVAGVGALTALAFVLSIGERDRFEQSRTVGAWVGLTPGQCASGQSDPQQRITKQGDGYLRHLLVNCAHYILGPFGPDCDLRRHGLAIAARGGKNAKKRAVIAVARKLAVLLHRLWCNQTIYEPLHNSNRASKAAA